MKVFEFSVKGFESSEWIVANDFASACQCFQDKCDLVDIQDGETMNVKLLNENDLNEKKFDPDPNGTGEFKESRAIPFKDAIAQRTDTLPYLLCSYID